jgi:uncharacterized protein YjbI with pentapeptide repeats
MEEIRAAGKLRGPTVFDLPLGTHARELSTDGFMEFACGTNGGPPSLPLAGGWLDYARCPVDALTGNHEIYFRTDDEVEYWARAHNLEMQVTSYQYTEVNNIPVIASALFDPDGFFVGLRLASDPRVDDLLRELGVTLGGALMARYGDTDWRCEDLPRLPAESEFRGTFIKNRCLKDTIVDGLDVALTLEMHRYRRAGQSIIDPREHVATTGQFESRAWFQALVDGPLPEREARLAAIAALGPPQPDPLVERARDCPGCDLAGANLKWANLAGANLEGANLAGANLHGAVLTAANLVGANLDGANLNRTTLRQADLSGATLTGGVMLYATRADGANFSGADMTGALAGKAELVRANLSGARLVSADLREARLNDANLSGADLTDSWMHNAQLIRADFTDAILVQVVARQVNLTAAKLAGADARAVDLFGANLRDADLTGADFSYSRLTSVNMRSATMTGTLFTEAELPAGFRPPEPPATATPAP